MNSESIFKKVKTCNSCKRELPEYFFGILRSSKDGYNPKCKDCRCTQKRLIKSPHCNEGLETYHLTKHNRKFLRSLPLESCDHEIVGLSLKNYDVWYLSFARDLDENTISLKGPNRKTLVFKTTGEFEIFISIILSILDQYCLRLFHPLDKNGLSNWGFSKKNLNL